MKTKNKSTKRKALLVSIGLMLLFFVALAAFGILHPAIAITTGFLAMGATIDLYDQSAHNPDGGNHYWIERIDKTTGAVVALGGLVTAIKITEPGTGYVTAPTVVITPFPADPGVNAAATAVLQGTKVSHVLITNAGSGYAKPPTITFTPTSGGTGAAATAYVSDGWHHMPGRASHDFESGQDETEVRHEGKGIWDTKKEPQKGTLSIQNLQMDVWTKNFFGKEACLYDWRVFMFLGQSRGTAFFSYRLIGRVRFPKSIKDTKSSDTFPVNAKVLENPSAITITEASLPVSGLAQAYDLAAKEVYCENEELVEPS
jgi:hypothetical protein